MTRDLQDALLKRLCSPETAVGGEVLDPALAVEDFYLACACGEMSAVTGFLESDPGLATRKGGVNGWEAIQYACWSSFLRTDAARAQGIVALVRLLLAAGAGPSASYMAEDQAMWPQTILFATSGVANHAELTAMLLAAGADVNEGLPEPDPHDPKKSPWGPEALYHSSEFRDTACLKLLLEAGPRLLYVSYCLARALDFENPAAIRLFVEHGADPDFRVPWARNRTHLHRAVINGRSAEIVDILLQAGGDPAARDTAGVSAYRDAVRYGRPDLQALFEQRCGPSDATEQDRAVGLLMQGRTDGPPPVSIDPELVSVAARRDDVAALKSLVAAGADLDAAGPDPMPPLHHAAWWGQLAALKFMVGQGADLYRRNAYGGDVMGTTLHGSENCHGADFGPVAGSEEDPADYVAIVEFLIAAGAKLPGGLQGSAPVQAVLRRHGVGI